MILSQHYGPNEKVVKRVIREIVLDILSHNIEKMFHLPTSNSFYKISYEKDRS